MSILPPTAIALTSSSSPTSSKGKKKAARLTASASEQAEELARELNVSSTTMGHHDTTSGYENTIPPAFWQREQESKRARGEGGGGH